jgi:hypothetical protein
MRISLSELGWVLYRGNRGRPKRVNQSRRSPKTRSLTGTPHRLIVRLNEMKQGKEVDVKVMGRDVKITLDSWPFSEWKPLKGASGLTGGCRATPPQCHRLTLHAYTKYMCIHGVHRYGVRSTEYMCIHGVHRYGVRSTEYMCIHMYTPYTSLFACIIYVIIIR